MVAVEQAILGMDFLAAVDLLVDPRHRCLLHQPSATVVRAEPCLQPTPFLTTFYLATYFEALVQEFPLHISPECAPAPVRHGVQHSIVTTGRSCLVRPRRLPPECLQAAGREFEHMQEEGIARPSDSNWASHLHMVPKPKDRSGGHAGFTGPRMP